MGKKQGLSNWNTNVSPLLTITIWFCRCASVVVLSQFVGLMVNNRIAIRHGGESHLLSSSNISTRRMQSILKVKGNSGISNQTHK